MMKNLGTLVSTQHKQPELANLLRELRGLPFYCNSGPGINCNAPCFWHKFTPIKRNEPQKCHKYESNIVDLLENKTHYLIILKSVGLGISTLCLYWLLWRITRDNSWSGKTVPVVLGPNWDLAKKFIRRIRTMFEEHHNIYIESKESQITINNCVIESFPSNHLSSFRSLEKPACTYISEADFFEKNQQIEVRHVAERYISKSGMDYYIILESTPNAPGQLFDSILKEEPSLYTKLRLDYTYGMNEGMYTPEEIAQARSSPSFSREMETKFLGQIGIVLVQVG
jgi:hypothetical protein